MFAMINDTEIFFDVMGESLASSTPAMKMKPTIVVLHGGLGLDHGYLRPGLDFLSIEFNLIYLDYRGHGRSADVPMNTITLEQCADDVKALCDYLGLDRPFILGHSAGGFVAQIFALRYPNYARGMILVSTSSGHHLTEEEKAGRVEPSLNDRAPQEVTAIAAKLFMPQSITDIFDEARARAHSDFFENVGPYYLAPQNMWKFKANMAFTHAKPRIMDYFVANILPVYNVADQIKQIDIPTLVIAGNYDWVCLSMSGEYIASQIADAQFVEFMNSGHMPFIEEPELFIPLVSKFIHENF